MTPATTIQGAELTYTAYASGRVPVDFRLEITPERRVELFLGTAASLRPDGTDTIGYFAGQVTAEQLAGLRPYLDDKRIAERPAQGPPPLSPEMAQRKLAFARDGRLIEVSLDGPDPDGVVDALEQRLMAIAVAVAREPERAVRATLALAPDRSEVRPTVTIAGVGRAPLEIELYSGAPANRALDIQVHLFTLVSLPSGGTMRRPLEDVEVPPRQIDALARRGALPRGVTALAPGAAYTIELPAISRPRGASGVQVDCTLVFWLAGPGPARRLASVRTRPVPLDPAGG